MEVKDKSIHMLHKMVHGQRASRGHNRGCWRSDLRNSSESHPPPRGCTSKGDRNEGAGNRRPARRLCIRRRSRYARTPMCQGQTSESTRLSLVSQLFLEGRSSAGNYRASTRPRLAGLAHQAAHSVLAAVCVIPSRWSGARYNAHSFDCGFQERQTNNKRYALISQQHQLLPLDFSNTQNHHSIYIGLSLI